MYKALNWHSYFSSDLPIGYTTGNVSKDMTGLVNSRWTHAARDSTGTITKTLRWGFPSACVFSDSGTPVAWALQKYYGFVAHLHTEKDHRRKGIGKYVLAQITKQIIQRGQISYAAIEKDNATSMHMFENMGYTRCPESMNFSWVLFSSTPMKENVKM